MENSAPLVWFGISAMILCAGFILIPYLRGKSDLLTAWNVLLMGVGMWVGFGCLEVRYGSWYWPNLQWFQPSRGEVRWYMLVTTCFIAALLISYYYIPIGRRFAAHRFEKWPPLNGATYLFVMSFCAVVAFASFIVPPTNFAGLVIYQLSHKAVIFGCVFSFLLWYNDRINVMWLGLFIGMFISAALFSMVVSGGRRLLLSVFLGPVLCLYWVHIRHWSAKYTLAALSVAATAILLVSMVYSTIRWFNRGMFKQERTAVTVIEQLQGLRNREGIFQSLFANKLNYFSQSNVHYGLLAKRYVDTGQLVPVPLNTLRFILSYPIPRRVWEGKPETLGIVVPHQLAKIPSTNWGLGPAGHAAYEGGIPAVMLYALLVSIGIRFLDDPLRRQPTNPFLISMHAAALPHVAGFARGDFGIMSIETGECFLFAFMLSLAARILFGTAPVGLPKQGATSPQRFRMLQQPRTLGPPRMNR